MTLLSAWVRVERRKTENLIGQYQNYATMSDFKSVPSKGGDLFRMSRFRFRRMIKYHHLTSLNLRVL